jgi:hypothetical protein
MISYVHFAASRCTRLFALVLLSSVFFGTTANVSHAQYLQPKEKPQAPPKKAAPKKPPALALSGLTGAEAPGGCGCSFYQVTNLKESGPLHLRFNTEKKAAIKPGGVLVPMTVVSESHVRRNKKTLSAKDKMLVKLRGDDGNTSASLVSTAERNCEKSKTNPEQCTKVTYQSILTLAMKGETRTYPLWGACSCAGVGKK